MSHSPKQRMTKLLKEMTGVTVQNAPWKGQLQSTEFRLALMCALYLDEDTMGINRVIDGLNEIK